MTTERRGIFSEAAEMSRSPQQRRGPCLRKDTFMSRGARRSFLSGWRIQTADRLRNTMMQTVVIEKHARLHALYDKFTLFRLNVIYKIFN